ncbi:MAG TPA: permease prefix domain 1-containing protein, partial [Microbacterium sp.]|nr:permease prefix domain 1-containing protein [Microbacterium sp.]
MTENTPHRPVGGDIHRLLDEAFAGVEMTPDARDLKEEVRANLVSRVAELESEGRPPADAAHRAIAELGDVRDLLDESPARPGYPYESLRHRVRPKPAFVVRIVIAALATAGGLLLAVLGATGVLQVPVGVTILLLGIGSTGVAWLVGDSLSQETTTNYPMPAARAGGFFWATLLMVFGVGVGLVVAAGLLPMWLIVFPVLAVAGSIVLYAWLGATQTNRHKAWVRHTQLGIDGHPVGSRFERDPELAARFGIYSMVIWLTAIAVAVVLYFTVGWVWIPLAFVG